jgi:uncharacterized protein YgbK (DUF1537 family)
MTQILSNRVGIVADDLTSATDGAAPFLAKGYTPLITRHCTASMRASVVSIDTHGRAATATQAAMSVASAIRALCDCSILLKTIDSTLRGHIHEEIVAAFKASGRNRLIIAPAFPDAGRLTVNGIQIVHGIPVSDSDYGSDPAHPAKTSRIADLIDLSLGLPVVLALDASHKVIAQAARARIVILDANSQETLNRQVACIPDPEAVLWVGSPGLAIALASLVPGTLRESPVGNDVIRRALIVAGSANPVTHAQCDALRVAKIPVLTNLANARRDAPVLCLCAPQERQQDANAVLGIMAEQAASLLARQDYGLVIATGGETMSAILDYLGISRFILTHELEPGFPVGLAEHEDGTRLTIAMKAGGFGNPATLLHAVDALMEDKGHAR